MKTALNIDITYDQVLSIVKSLPVKQKLKLSKELEKEGIKTRLDSLLSAFKTDEVSLEDIDKEAELVRQRIYDRKKH
jgi:hypothetical protein